MIDRVAELNRLLFAMIELMSGDGLAKIDSVLAHCASTVIEGRMPDHDMTLKYAVRIGFIRKTGESIVLTETGKAFLAFSRDDLYDLTDEQKQFLLRNCYLQGPFREEARTLLEGFVAAHSKGVFRWSVDNPPLPVESWIIEHLRQLGLIDRGTDWIEVIPAFTDTIADFLAEEKGLSELKFQELMKTKLEIGDLAEELIMRFEAQRLLKGGYALESQCIRRISKLVVNAGYDIESFDGRSPDVRYNRFIEVKGAKGPDVRFFWSDNEMNVAKKLKDKYWIYFQGGIDMQKKTSRNKPLLFRNPLESILRDDRFSKTPQGVIVEGKIRGEALIVS